MFMNIFDRAVFRWFNGLAVISPGFNKVVVFLTRYAPLLFGILFLVFFVPRRRNYHQIRRTIILAILSGVLGLVVSVLLASLLYRPRPFAAMPHHVHLLLPHSPDSSFPSDHATGSAGFAVGMWPAPHRLARWLFTLLAILVGISRLIAGVHWPSDILGSFLLGGLSAQAIWSLAGLLSPLVERVLKMYENLETRFLSR